MNFGKFLTEHLGTNAATLKNNSPNLFPVTPLTFHFFFVASLWINHLVVPIMTTKCSTLVNNSDYCAVKSFQKVRQQDTKRFSVNFKLKGKIKKMSVITKDKLLIYQLVKIIEVIFILLFLMIYSLLFGISLKVFCIFFLRLEIFSNQKCLSKHCYIYLQPFDI